MPDPRAPERPVRPPAVRQRLEELPEGFEETNAPPPPAAAPRAPAPAGASKPLLSARLRNPDEAAAEVEFRLDAPADDAAPEFRRAAGSIWSLTRAVAVVLLVAVVLFVTAQVVSLAREINTWPDALRYPAFAVVGLVTAWGLWNLLRIAYAYARLRTSPRVLVATREMRQRARARDDQRHQHPEAARRLLTPILADYPTDPSHFARLRQFGATDLDWDQLKARRHELLTDGKMPDELWLRRLDETYLPVLDQLARRAVRRRSIAAGLATAAAPRGAFDAIIVFAISVRLVRDICTIYHLRANNVETGWIAARLLVDTLIARGAEDATDAITGSLHDHFATAGQGVLGAVASGAEWATGKAATGAINAGLMWRFGHKTVQAIRPLDRRTKWEPGA